MILKSSRPRHRSLVLLCLLTMAASGLDLWQRTAQSAGARMWLDSAVGAISAPFQAALMSATWRLRTAWLTAARARLLARENADLAARVAELEGKLDALGESLAERQRLRALRSAYPSSSRPRLVARVIGTGSGGWISCLVIDRGGADGVRPRDVAVTPEGVVGQVYAVAEQTASVLPITDPASGVAVRARRSRETGVVKGASGRRCELVYLAPQAQVRPGDKLITAGLGGVFPKGLLVGRVVSVTPDPLTSGKKAEVEPAVNLHNVEEVLLLRARRPEN